MKSKRRLVIMLTYATAVFLAAKAQSSLEGLANQIIFGAIYLGPAVVLHIMINRFWGGIIRKIIGLAVSGDVITRPLVIRPLPTRP